MSKNALLSIDDWLECDKPLCPVIIRHDGKIEESEEETYKVCFSTSRIGGAVLDGGQKQEDMIFSAFPELFMMLMSTELLENNEAFTAHGLKPFVNSHLKRMSGDLDKDSETKQMYISPNTHICFIDAADFSTNPAEQYQPTSILRELNKAFIGFSQQPPKTRLPPIGKSCSSTPPENQSPTNDASKSTPLSEPDETNKTVDHLTMDMMRSLLGQQGGLSNYLSAMLISRKSAHGNVAHGSRQDLNTMMAPVGCESEKCTQNQTTDARECFGNNSLLNEQSKHMKTENDDDNNVTENIQSLPSTTSQDAKKDKPSVPPFNQKAHQNSLIREDSDDSLYRDCDENVQTKCSTAGLSLQRPLRFNTYKPTPKQACVTKSPTAKVSSRPWQIPHVANIKNHDLPSSSLEGASMEASFISCRTHLSSSSSKSSSSSEGQLAEDFEQGFESCMEEEDDTNKGHAFRSADDVQQHEDISGEQAYSLAQLPVQHPWRSNQLHNEDEMSYSTLDNGIIELRLRDEDNDDMNERREAGYALRRSASTGFILDEDDDDIFVGDGLEHEREWLANFRHRSTNPSCSISRRNSSRYSFSSDFSSDLEDILEHFEEKMTEGPVRDDPTYCSRLGHGRLLKRTLSDSLTSLTRMPLGSCPRSLSLTEKMQQERIGLEVAKRKIIKEPESKILQQPMPLKSSHPGWSKTATEEESLDSFTVKPSRGASMDNSNMGSSLNSPLSKTKVFQLPGQLVCTMTVDNDHSNAECFLSEHENEETSVTLPLRPSSHGLSHPTLSNLPRLSSQVSVAWWNYNSVYDFYVPLNQCETAPHRCHQEDSNNNSHNAEENSSRSCSLTIVTRSNENLSYSQDNPSSNQCQTLTSKNANDDCIPSLVITCDKDAHFFEAENKNESLLMGHDLASSPQRSDSSQLSSPDSMENFKRIMYGYQDINAKFKVNKPLEATTDTTDKDIYQCYNLICRSKSMLDAKEMETTIRNEQGRSARWSSACKPCDLKAYCLKSGNKVCRSISTKNMEELIKQEIWIMKGPIAGQAGDQQQTFDNSEPFLDSFSSLRKWHASINLSDIALAEEIRAEPTETLSKSTNLSEDQGSSGPDMSQKIRDDDQSEFYLNSSRPTKLGRRWFSEDHQKRRQLDILLEEDMEWKNVNQDTMTLSIQPQLSPQPVDEKIVHVLQNVTETVTTHTNNALLPSNPSSKFSLIGEAVTERTHGVAGEVPGPSISGDACSRKADVSSAASPCLHSLRNSSTSNRNKQLSQNKIQQRTSDVLLEMALNNDGIKPIATGNWGCGHKSGDPQLKAMIQWIAASKANAPFMMYYTGGDQRIVKLNIVCRVLLDRHWSVSHIARAMLQHYSKKAQSDMESEIDFLDCLLPKETTEL